MSATQTTNLGLNKPDRQDYVSVVSDINQNMDRIDSSVGNIITPVFSPSTAYSVGDYVIYNRELYRFTTAHPAGSWNSSHVAKTNLAQESNSLKSAVTNIENIQTINFATTLAGAGWYTSDTPKIPQNYKVTFTNNTSASSAFQLKKPDGTWLEIGGGEVPAGGSVTFYNTINSEGFRAYCRTTTVDFTFVIESANMMELKSIENNIRWLNNEQKLTITDTLLSTGWYYNNEVKIPKGYRIKFENKSADTVAFELKKPDGTWLTIGDVASNASVTFINTIDAQGFRAYCRNVNVHFEITVDSVNLMDINTLKRDLNKITGNEAITFTNGYYIKTDIDVGSAVTLTPVQGSGRNNYAIINASEGDEFTINGTGGSAGRLYCFIDSSNNVLRKAGDGVTAKDIVIVAPENTSKLILNILDVPGVCCKNRLIGNAVDNLESQMVGLNNKQTITITDTLSSIGWYANDSLIIPKGYRVKFTNNSPAQIAFQLKKEDGTIDVIGDIAASGSVIFTKSYRVIGILTYCNNVNVNFKFEIESINYMEMESIKTNISELQDTLKNELMEPTTFTISTTLRNPGWYANDNIPIPQWDAVKFVNNSSEQVALELNKTDDTRKVIGDVAAGESVSFISTVEAKGIRVYCRSTDANFVITIKNASAIKLNDEIETMLKLEQISNDATSSTSNIKPLTLLHFSDLHNNYAALHRIVEFRNHYAKYISDTIHTGDIVNNCNQETTNPLSALDGAENILNIIGNHDTWDNTGETSEYWHSMNESGAYTRYVAPFVDDWGSNIHVQENKAYYYKDYPGSNVRLIVLDCMHESDAQLTWFANTLSDALSNGIHVLVANHVKMAVGGSLTYLDSGFDTPFYNGKDATSSSAPFPTYTPSAYIDAVDTFVSGGGYVIGWICGHIHIDSLATYHNILNVIVTTAGDLDHSRTNDARIAGSKSFDAFNIIGIDTERKILTLMRIGLDYNDAMGKMDTLCWDYANHRLIHTS